MTKNGFPRIHVSSETRRKMLEIASEFRKAPTKGEKILWASLRGKKLDGIKFRRQQPIRYFVVDFYSSAYRLVVEVYGPIHDFQKEADKARQEILGELGLIILRIKSEVIESNLSMALTLIRDVIRNIRQSIPSPLMGEGGANVCLPS